MGREFLQFLWLISFGRYTRCIAASEEGLSNASFPLNPLAFFLNASVAVLEGVRYLNMQIRPWTELLPPLPDVITVPAEFRFVTVHSSAWVASDGPIGGGTAATSEDRIVNNAKPLNKHI